MSETHPHDGLLCREMGQLLVVSPDEAPRFAMCRLPAGHKGKHSEVLGSHPVRWKNCDRLARPMMPDRPAVPAPGADPVYEVCCYCGGDIAWIDARWRAVQSRYPNEAHCHYSATAERRSIGHLPEAERGAS